MRTKKTTPPNRIWIYVVVFVALGIVLTLLLVKQKSQPTNPSAEAERVNVERNNIPGTTNEGVIPSGAFKIPGDKGAGLQPQDTQKGTGQQANENTSDHTDSNTQSNNGVYAPLGCFVDLGPVCSIGYTDNLYAVLGQDPNTELLVNGVLVKPEKIIYKVGYGVYPDEQITDGQGKVISSTNKGYDANTKTLTLTIGVNSNYYNNLQSTQQHTLLLSQTVRSFLAMFGETSENFIQVEKMVNSLGSWQPTQ